LVESTAASLVELGHQPAFVKTERFGPTGGTAWLKITVWPQPKVIFSKYNGLGAVVRDRISVPL